MGAALSEDLRKRVVSTVEAGASQRQAAQRFGVSLSSAKYGGDNGDNTAMSPPSRKAVTDARTASRNRPISS